MKIKIGKYPKKATSNRKIDIQVDNYDTWSLDHTLAHVIYPGLVQLRATKHGVPSEFANVGGDNASSQDSFDFYKETYDEAFDLGIDRWNETLDKMIWSFDQILRADYDEKYHHGKLEWDFVESDHTYPNPVTGKLEKTYQMVDKNPNEHWYDMEGHTLHEERIQEGLELFGKYFRNLWD
jgi:hypothetical protein